MQVDVGAAPNYYDIVVAVARMIGSPKVSYWQVKTYALRFAELAGRSLDIGKLETAYKDFTRARDSHRGVYR